MSIVKEIYSPNSFYYNNFLVIYDVILSSCRKKIYIFFNTMIHLCNNNLNIDTLPKRTRNYIREFKKILNINSLNSDKDIEINIENTAIKNSGWIHSENTNFKFAYELCLETPVNKNEINIQIKLCSINKILRCNFSKIYVQKGDIAAVIHFKNENEFLNKWIEHYIKLGVTHFYIYNNNPDNHNEYDKLNEKYKNLTFLDWGFPFDIPNGFSQMCCFNHSMNLLRNRFNWVLYTDIDEYVVIKNKSGTLTELVSNYDIKKTASLNFQCLWFGCSHNIEYTPDDFLNKLIYTSGKPVYKKTKDKRHYRNAKCIHNPLLNTVIGNHISLESTGEQLVLSPDLIRFNHYFTMTTWGRDRFFSKSWDKSEKHTYKKKCNCDELCKVKNTELNDIYYLSN